MTDLTFIEGQPWQIEFTAHDELGEILPLTSGAEVEMRISRTVGVLTGNVLVIDVTNGVVITNPTGGVAVITITEEAQNSIDPPLSSDDICFYEIRAYLGGVPEHQASGRLIIENSLFSEPDNAYIDQFRARFPEFDTTTDPTIAMHILEAQVFVDSRPALALSSTAGMLALLYYAAHLLQLSKRAALLASSGGSSTTGQVKSLSVEDRTVTFATPTGRTGESATSSTQGLLSTVYGQRYSALLRLFPTYIMRA